MKLFKKFYSWEEKQTRKPETLLAIWIAFGVIFGVGIDNIGVGIAIGVAIGASLYSKAKNKTHKK